MKRIYLPFILVILTGHLFSQTPAWTRLNPFPQAEEIIDITRIPGTNRLIAAGICSTVMISDDIGETWQIMTYPGGMPQDFFTHGFYFVNETTGFLFGRYHTILKTTDSGLTWEIKYGPDNSESEFTVEIEFISDSVGFAVGNGGVLLRTVDLGETWIPVESGAEYDLHNIGFINDTDGYITSYNKPGELLKTVNGGNSWVCQAYPEGLPDSEFIRDLYFVDSTTGFAFMYKWEEDGGIYKTTDGGLSWVQVLTDADGYNGKFSFVDPEHGIAYCHNDNNESRIMITSDGGNSWSVVEQAEEAGICAIALNYYNQNIVFSGGYYGCMFKSVDGGYTWEQLNYNALNGVIDDAIVFDENNGILLTWVPYESSSIVKTNDGFNSFETILSFPYNTSCIDFPHIDSGYCVAFEYPDLLIYRTTNGGIDWQKDTIHQEFPPEYLMQIDFFNVQKGAILQYGKIRLTMDGGNTWIEKVPQENGEYQSIDYVTENKIVIAGTFEEKTALFVSNDNGETWQTDSIPSLTTPGDIRFINETDAFMLTESQVFKSTDGGYSWLPCVINGNAFNSLRDISFPTQDTGYMVGWAPYGNVLKSTDAGNTWNPVNAPVTAAFSHVEFLDSETGFIFNLNDIFKTSAGGVVNISSPEFSTHENIFNVYPNPFSRDIRVDISNPGRFSPYDMVIFNAAGEQVYSTTIHEGTSGVIFYGTMLKPGMYFFQFRKEGSVVETEKMIKLK